jgi:hypothetical protein
MDRPAGEFRLAGSLRGSRGTVLGTHRLYLSDDSRLQVEGSSGCVVITTESDGRVCDANTNMLGACSELVFGPP